MLTSLAFIFMIGLAMVAVCLRIKLPRIIGMLLSGIPHVAFEPVTHGSIAVAVGLFEFFIQMESSILAHVAAEYTATAVVIIFAVYQYHKLMKSDKIRYVVKKSNFIDWTVSRRESDTILLQKRAELLEWRNQGYGTAGGITG